MYCDYCGSELRDGAKFCPKCGKKIVADSIDHSDAVRDDRTDMTRRSDPYHYSRGDYNDRSGGMHDAPRRKKKSKWIIIVLAALLTVSAVCGAVIYFILMNTGMNTEKAYKKYFQVLDQTKDSVVEFENDCGANGVAFYDVNDSGVSDVLYITKNDTTEPDADSWYLHCLTDTKDDIEIDTEDDISGGMQDWETLFLTDTDNCIYVLNKNRMYTLTYEKDESGKGTYRVDMIAVREYDEEKEEYSCTILSDSGEMESVSEDEYNEYVDDICSRNVTILISTLTDEELKKTFPSIVDNLSDNCDDALKRLKDGDLAPIGNDDKSSSAEEDISSTKKPEGKTVLAFSDNEHNLMGDFTTADADVVFKTWQDFVSDYPQVADPMNAGEEYYSKMHITIFCLKDNEGNVIDKKGVMNATGFGLDPCDWKTRFGEFDWMYTDSTVNSEDYEDDDFCILYEEKYYSGSADCHVINAKLREYVTLGTYEQDGDEGNGKEPIEWLILTQDDEKMLVVSKYCLDYLRYPDDWGSNVVWETSSLRSYLNSDFIDNTFSAQEQQQIILSENENKASEEFYSTVDGNPTEDKVFLLSIDEVQTYLPNSTSSELSFRAYGTDYLYDILRQHQAYGNAQNGNPVSWALRADTDTTRNPEKVGMPREIVVSDSRIFCCITTGGLRDPDGPLDVIRPAMWIKNTVQKDN